MKKDKVCKAFVMMAKYLVASSGIVFLLLIINGVDVPFANVVLAIFLVCICFFIVDMLMTRELKD